MNVEKVQYVENSEVGGANIRLLWVVPAASLAATIANVIFYFIVTQWFHEPLLMPNQYPPPSLVPMDVGEVILFSVIWSLGASFVYAVLISVSDRPERTFIIISTIVLFASFGLPLKAPTPPIAISAKMSLVVMHIIGAIAVVGLLITLGRRRAKTRKG